MNSTLATAPEVFGELSPIVLVVFLVPQAAPPLSHPISHFFTPFL
jgi:hypothetical protein